MRFLVGLVSSRDPFCVEWPVSSFFSGVCLGDLWEEAEGRSRHASDVIDHGFCFCHRAPAVAVL